MKDKLDRYEWDFCDVPSDEMRACVLYEYARESKLICALARAGREGGLENDEDWRRLRKIVLPYPYDSDGFQQYIAFDEFRPETPWQKLPQTTRRNFQLWALPRGIYRGGVLTLLLIDSECKRRRQKIEDAYRQRRKTAEEKFREKLSAWEKSARKKFGDDISKWPQRPFADPQKERNATPTAKELAVKPSETRSGVESTVLKIDWQHFTNKQLAAGFNEWISANRPPEIPEPKARGQKDSDAVARLDALGIMRLRFYGTVRELKLWNCAGAELRRRFEKTTKGLERSVDERRALARATYHKLFSFETSEPRAWPRTRIATTLATPAK